MTELNALEIEAVDGGLSVYRPVPAPVKPTICPRPPVLDELFA